MGETISVVVMDSSNNKVTDSPSGSQVEQIMQSAHKRTFSAGGQKGYFVSVEDLAYLEKVTKERKDMKNHVLLADDQVERLAVLTAELKSQNSKSEQKLKNLQDHLDDTYTKLQRAEAERGTAKAAATKALENKKALKDELLASKREWDGHVKRLESAAATSDLSDPVDLKTIGDELVIARNHAKDAQAELERLNKEISVKNTTVSSIVRQKEALQASYDEAMSNYNTIHEAWKNAQQSTPPPEVINVLANIKLDASVQKLIGAKSYAWLEKLKEVPAANIRDTTFHLLGAARDSSNKQVSKLTALLQKVFEWVKTHSNKMRDNLKPWLDTIARDIALGKVRTMAFYRIELEKLVADFKSVNDKAVAVLKQKGEKESFTTNASSWIKVLFYYRPKRYFAKSVGFIKTTFSKTMKSLKKVLSGIASYFTSTKSNVVAEEKVIEDAHEFDVSSIPSSKKVVVPEAPKLPKPKTKIQLMSEKAFGKQPSLH